MGIRCERHVERGQSAWLRGELERAATHLEAALRSRPELPEAVFALARTRFERGERLEAIGALAESMASGRFPKGGHLHLAWMRFDVGDHEALRADVAALGPDNHVADALSRLEEVRAGTLAPADLPPAALWSAEIAGRVLALLEERRSRRVPLADDELHHALFSPVPPAPAPAGASGPEGPVDPAPEPPPPVAPRQRKEWNKLLTDRFARREFAAFLELWSHPEVPEAWRAASDQETWLFARVAASPAGDALGDARALVAEGSGDVGIHFLHGLAALRGGEAIEAAQAFVRAARLDDVQIHDVIQRLLSDEDREDRERQEDRETAGDREARG